MYCEQEFTFVTVSITAISIFFQYAAIVLLVLILELAGVAVTWLFFDKLELTLQNYLDVSLEERYQGNYSKRNDGTFTYTSGGDPVTLAWDIVQVSVRIFAL